MQNFKSIILLTLTSFFLVYSQIIIAQTTLEGGDLAIVGVNANNFACSGINAEDRVSFVCFKEITPGTVIDITDNGWERASANLFGDTEGTMRGTYNGTTIPAGQVINFVIDNSGNIQSNTHFGWAFTNLNNPPGLTHTMNLNNSGDQLYFMQGGTWDWGNPGGSTHDASYSGSMLYGFNTTSTWTPFVNNSQNSGLHPEVVPCFHMEPSTGQSDYQKYTGPMTATTQVEWIDRIGNSNNWSSFSSCTVFLSTAPDYESLITLPILPSEMSIDCSTCTGGCGTLNTDLIFNLPSTGGPFDVIYTDGTNEFTLTNISNGHTESVSVSQSTTYSLVSVTQADNCPSYSNFAGDAVITISGSSGGGNASLTGGGVLCTGECATVTITIAGGTAPYNLTTNISLPPFSFTSAPILVPTTNFVINVCSQSGIPGYNPTTNTVTIPPAIFGNGTVSLISLSDANGCDGTVDGTPLAFSVQQGPNAFPATMSTCTGANGMAVFDLTSVNSTVNGGNTNTVTWYSDANGNNQITNPTMYSTATNTTVYAIVSNPNCDSDIQPVTLTISPSPSAFPASLTECSSSAQANFDLTSVNSTVNGGNTNTVNWYTDPSGNSQILIPSNYLSGNGTVYAEVTSNGCASVLVPVTLTISPAPTGVPTSLTECESLFAPTFADFDLNTINNIVNGGTTEPVAWFLDAATTFPIINGMLAAQNNTVVYAEVGTAPCTSAAIPVTLLVIPSPSANIPPPLDACAIVGNQALFDLTALDNTINNGATVTIEWFSDLGGNNMIFNPSSHLSPTGFVYAGVSNGTCTSSIIPVSLNVIDPPTANSTGAAACDLGNGTASFDLSVIGLDVNNNPLNTVNWFADQAGNNPIPSPYVTGSTTIYASVTNGTCSSQLVAVNLVLDTAPSANANVSATLCDSGNGTADFDLVALASNVNSDGTLTFNWYADANGNNPIPSPYNTTSTNVYVEVSNGNCSSPLTLVTLNVTTAPTAMGTSMSICDLGNGTATFDLTTIESTVNGASTNPVVWYSDITLGNSIPTTYTTGSTTVYAVVGAGSCSSQPVAVMLNVTAAPTGNTGVMASACNLGDNTADFDLDAIATMITNDPNLTVNWFLYINQTNPLTSPFNTPTTFVFAVVSDGTCNSPSIQVDLNVIDPPTANTTSATLCEVNNGEAIFDLTSLESTVNAGSGNTVSWSSDINGNNTLTSPYTTSTTTIYAVVNDANCPSAPVAVDLIVENNPTATSTIATACNIGNGTGDFNLTALENTINGGTTNTVTWYQDMNGNTPILNTFPYNSFPTTIYAVVTVGNCSSDFTAITLTLENGITANPASATLCDDGTGMATFDLTLLESTISGGLGYTINWYSDALAMNPISTTYTTSTTDIYAVATSSGCSSAPVLVSLTVTPAPVANQGVTSSGCNLGDNTSDFDLLAIATLLNTDPNTVVSWFLTPNMSNPISSPFNTASTSIYAFLSLPDCTSGPTEVVLSVLSAPVGNPTSATECEISNGQATFNLTDLENTVNGGSGDPVSWFSDINATVSISSPYSTGTTVVYAVVTGSNTCSSTPVPVDLIVAPIPTAISTSTTSCDLGDGTADFDLTQLENTVNDNTGNTVIWYSDINGNNIITSPYNTSTVTVFAIVDDGICTSAPTPVTLTVEAELSANPTSTSECDSGNGTATFDLTALENIINGNSGNTVNWYSDMATNNSIVSPYNSGTTTIYATMGNGNCTSSPVAIPLNIINLPTAITTSASECESANGMADFNLTALNDIVNNNTTNSVTWYSDPNAMNIIPSPYSTGTTTVYAVVNDGVCSSAPVAVDLTVDPIPTGVTTSTDVCNEGNNTATFDLTPLESIVNGGTTNTISWYANANGTSIINSPFTTSTVTIYAVVDDGNCESLPVPVDLNVVNGPTISPASASLCDEGVGTATFNLTDLENTVNNGSGNTVIWYEDPNGVTEIFSPYVSTSNTIYAIVIGAGCNSVIEAIDLTVDPLPMTNTASATLCDSGNGTADFILTSLENTVNDGTTNTVTWYADINLNTPINSPYNSGTTTIYAVVSNGTCSAEAVPVSLNITTTITANSTPLAACDDGTGNLTGIFNLLDPVFNDDITGGTGAMITFFSDPMGMMPLSPPLGAYLSSSTSIYAIVTSGTCQSLPVEISLTVLGEIEAFQTSVSECDSGNGTGNFNLTTIADLITGGNGNTVDWFSDQNMMNPISSPYNSGPATIYAVASDGFCFSNTVEVTLVISQSISGNETTATLCDEGNNMASFDLDMIGESVNPSAAVTINWYSDPAGTMNIFPPYVTASTSVYAVVANGFCETDPIEVTLEVVNNLDAFPVTDSKCDEGNGTATFDLNGLASQVNGGNTNTVLWFSDMDTLNSIPSPYVSSNNTVFAVVTDGSCYSEIVEVTLNVTTTIDAFPANDTQCDEGNGTATFPLTNLESIINDNNGNTVTWYEDPNGTISITPPFSSISNTIYAIVVDGACTSAAVPVALTVATLPTASSTSSSLCDEGNGIAEFDLIALENIVNGATNNTVNWYENSDNTGAITPPYSTTTTTIFATVSDGDCTSNPVAINLTVDDLPDAFPITETRCNEGNNEATFDLDAMEVDVNGNTANTVSWYSNAAATIAITTPYVSGNANIYAVVSDGTCVSEPVEITLVITNTLDAFPTSSTECDEGNGTAIFDLDGLAETVNGGTGYQVNWFFNATATNPIPSPYTTSASTVYAVVVDGNCTSIPVAVDLVLGTSSDANPASESACDIGDGTADFILTTLENTITGNNGNTVLWFEDINLTTSITPPYNSSSTSIFAVSANGNCLSAPVLITLDVTASLPANPTSNTLCNDGSDIALFDLDALENTVNGGNGLTVNWFENIDTTLSINSPYSSGTTIVYAVVDNGNCTSQPVAINLTVADVVSASSTSATLCDDGNGMAEFDLTTLEDVVNQGSGNPVIWYEDINLNNVITNSFTTSATTVYAVVQDGICTSEPTPVDLQINSTPTGNSITEFACDTGNGTGNFFFDVMQAQIITTTTDTVFWFAQNMTTPLTGGPLNSITNQVIFAQVFDGTCFSELIPVTVIVNNAITAVPASDLQCADANGMATFDLDILANTVNGGNGLNVSWFEDENGLTPITTSTLNTTTSTIYATIQDGQCASDTVAVSLVAATAPQIFPANDTQCDIGNGTANFDLDILANIVNGGTTNTVNWFSDPLATLAINSIYNTSSTSVFAIVTDGNCVSNIQEVVLTVGNNLTAFPTNDNQCDIGNGTADFDLDILANIVNGGTTNTVNWFSDPLATLPINSSYNTSATSVFATVTDGNCTSDIVEITLGVTGITTTLIDDTLCDNEEIFVNGNPYNSANPMGTETIIGGNSNGCDSIVTIDLSFENAVSGSFSVSASPICPGSETTIIFSLTGGTTYDVTYSEGITPITLTGISDGHTITVSPTSNTIYSLLSITLANSTCDAIFPFDQLEIQVEEMDALIAVTSMYDNYNVSCFGGSDGELVAGPTSGSPPFDYAWNTGDNTPLINNAPAGFYEITITDAMGCSAIVSAELTQPDLIEFDFTTIPPPCLDAIDGQIILNNITGGIGDYEFSIDSNSITPVLGDTTLIDFLLPGFHDLTIYDEFGCSVGANILIQDPIESTVTLGDDQIIELGDSIELVPEANFSATEIFWSTTAPCLDCPSQFVTPTYETEYSVLMIDENGCQASDTVLITVEKFRRVYIPNAFSPDDNGVNDIFFINAGQDVAIVKNFKIFTRWGEVVYSAEDFQPNDASFGWDGFFKNQKLNPGVYVYYAEIEFKDGLTEVFKGDVTLQR